ncbi:hypothetical protein ACIBG4_08805 [Nonomuraea sp. NPDC050383]|uniref:hypothetical protein n=1 Tax=Nonomuraea sp. NPDC050383 TaxID=3364362 RepID=UPI00378B0E4D
MTDWLTRSFQQYSVLWILLSSLVGGIIGAGVKFFFEDLLRPFFGARRATNVTVRKYTTPLVRSAESLERRINNFVRNIGEDWYESSPYYRLSSIYTFANFLAWVRSIEEEFGFLPYESSRFGKRFNRRLYGPFKALSSFSYFGWSKDPDAVDASQLPRLMLSAMGEVALDQEGKAPLSFSSFAVAHERDAQLRRWFADLDAFLQHAAQGDPYVVDRLIAAGANLRALITFLDPGGALVPRRRISNLELVPHAEVADQLRTDFPELLPKAARSGISRSDRAGPVDQ